MRLCWSSQTSGQSGLTALTRCPEQYLVMRWCQKRYRARANSARIPDFLGPASRPKLTRTVTESTCKVRFGSFWGGGISTGSAPKACPQKRGKSRPTTRLSKSRHAPPCRCRHSADIIKSLTMQMCPPEANMASANYRLISGVASRARRPGRPPSCASSAATSYVQRICCPVGLYIPCRHGPRHDD